jgi:hypothetical protein
MTRILIALGFLLLLSCKEISFENPQPEEKKALRTMPKSLQGKYLAVTEDGGPSKDTVIITANGYRFGYFDAAERSGSNDEYERGVLSDTLVLKAYKGYYFLSLYEKPEWLLRVLKQEKNGDLTYMSMEEKDTDFNDYVNKLAQEIRIDSFQVEDKTIYRVDPTPNQLVELIDKGYFSKSRLVRLK